MSRQARLLGIVLLLSAALHALGIARTIVPAQDGLKFLRVARAFQAQPFAGVVRGSDQHPLYPLAVALAEPVVAACLGHGPETWRIAAQVVPALASLVLLLPLYGLGRALFDDARVGLLAALLWALLPLTGTIGHDTLADPLALCLFAIALYCGERALRISDPRAALGCGLAAGLGYWTRPEVAVLPVTVLGVAALTTLGGRVGSFSRRLNGRSIFRPSGASRTGPHDSSPPRETDRAYPVPAYAFLALALRMVVLSIGFLTLVGAYALVKGEVSEKLALRRAAAVASIHDAPKAAPHPLPPGLDNQHFDFAPKEESERLAEYGLIGATLTALGAWAEGLGWIFAPLALWGAWRVPVHSVAGRRLVAAYVLIFGAVLVRHAMGLGYLSGRHALTVVLATLPWAAAGTLAVADRLSIRLRLDDGRARRMGRLVLAGLVVVCVTLQLKPAHASRWGHHAAGLWLAGHAEKGDAVLDTRGWAAFASGLRAYDPWHVRQALTDSRLAYVVVGADELEASSRRAATLRALLDHAGRVAASFPARRGGSGADVLVYRFQQPGSWEGFQP